MGSIINAKCICGYKTKDLYFGAGMEDFKTECSVPALQNGSAQIEMKNYKKKHLLAEYIFYTDSLFTELIDSSKTINFFNVKIHQENNLCPKCKNYTMSFIDVGCFD